MLDLHRLVIPAVTLPAAGLSNALTAKYMPSNVEEAAALRRSRDALYVVLGVCAVAELLLPFEIAKWIALTSMIAIPPIQSAVVLYQRSGH